MTAPHEPGRVGSSKSAGVLRASIATPLVLGIVVAISSWIVPLSYDEGNWLTVTRRVAVGERLYSDITDNKGPVLFGLVRLLDVLPGPYPLARGVFLGIAAAMLSWLCARLFVRAGTPEPAARMLGTTIGLAGAMQAVLVVNFELPAVLLVLAGLTLVASGRDLVAGVIAGLAVTFDLRAAVLLPGVVLFALASGGKTRAFRATAGAAVPVLAWSALVLANGDLRYSLLELNVATRGGAAAWRPASALAAFARAMVFPVAAVAVLTARAPGKRRWPSAAALALMAGGLAAAVLSVQPFDKYWTLLLPGLAVVGFERVLRVVGDRAKVAALLCISLAPSAVYATTSSIDQARIVARYERAAREISILLGPGGRFVRFDSNPFVGTFLPERDLTPAAVLDFLIAPTSRESANLAAVSAAITRAAAIVDDGALAVPARQVLPGYRKLHATFSARLQEFPCVRATNGLTVRLRPTFCP